MIGQLTWSVAKHGYPMSPVQGVMNSNTIAQLIQQCVLHLFSSTHSRIIFTKGRTVYAMGAERNTIRFFPPPSDGHLFIICGCD